MPRSVLVIGGTGGVGTGIVLALLAFGSFARIVVSSRSAGKLAALRERAGDDPRLITIVGGIDDEAAAATLLGDVLALGELGAVVASIGGWWSGGDLLNVDRTQWHAAFASLLTPHFIAARAFVPVLEVEGGRYVLVGGGAAFRAVPGAALVSIAGAAQAMLTRAIVAERPGRAYPVIEELVVDGPVETHAAHHGARRANEITAREVGEVVAQMLHDGTTGAWPNVRREGPIVTIYSASANSS